MPKLSILVPVYNVEEFLPLCLESIINQSFKDFECILINDGSTDGSLRILEKYAKLDKRFKILNQKNFGYGKSLNNGLKLAKGKYIGIVEPDDFLHRDFYKTLMSKKSDIIKCGFMNFYGKTWKTFPERVFHELRITENKNGVKTTARISKDGTEISPKENEKIFLTDPTIWSAIYKKEMLEKNKIKFLETAGASYQDAGFQFKTFASAKTIFCLEQPLYYYRRDNEKSSVKSDKKIFAIKTEFDEIDNFIEGREEFKEIAKACRFRSYNWNLNRLKFKEALKFSKTAKSDYKNSNFNPNYFVKEHHSCSHELKFSTKHPKIYTFLRPIFRLKNSTFRLVAKICHK
ncbi:glycosyltransferase [Candidatus Saccharibacteria bacterium]|nr:glycosyltransferase [Candidatus Saccharibacteria bacterium]